MRITHRRHSAFTVTIPEGIYLVSFSSVIAFKPNNKIASIKLDERFWDYSKTTILARNSFLDEDSVTTKRKVDSGEYELMNLND